MTADEARELFANAERLLGQGQLDQAESVARQLAGWLEDAADGPAPPVGYGTALALLSNVLLTRDGPDAAEKVFEAALRHLPSDVPGHRRASVLLSQADLLQHLNKREEAARAVTASIAAVEAAAQALDLTALGDVFAASNRFRGLGADPQPAVAALASALATVQTQGAPGSRLAVQLHEQLKRVLFGSGRYTDALPHARFLVSAQAERHGATSAEAGDAYADYGLALDQTGSLPEAEAAYRRALDILHRQRGERDRSVTQVRFNLAELARAKGALSDAERQFRALEAEDRAQYPDPANRNASILTNYGLVLLGLGRFTDARERLTAALQLRAARDGTRSRAYARVLLALGQLARQTGDYQTALDLFERTAAIRDDVGGNADYARFEAALTRIHVSDRDTAAADARQLIRAAQTTLGEHHPDVFGMLDSLVQQQVQDATLSELSESARRGLRADIEEADDIARFLLGDLLRSLGGRALQEPLIRMRRLQQIHLSLVIADAPRDQQAIDRAWRMAARYRAAETTALRLRARRYSQYDPTATRARIGELNDMIVRVDLALTRGGESAQLLADRARYQEKLAEAEFQLSSATNLGRLDLEFSGTEQPLVQLDADAAVVFVAGHWDLTTRDPACALFLVGPAPAPVQLVNVGDATTLDEAIQRFRDAIVREGRRATPDERAWRDPGLVLTSRLIDPLRSLLPQARRIRVLADGRIALLPLGALPLPQGGYVIDEFDITYDVSLRALGSVLFEEDTGIEAPPAVFGAPAYSTGAVGTAENVESSEFLSQFRGGGRFETLAHSEDECREIAALLRVDPVLGQQATEKALLALKSPEVLHVSTHGFFLENRPDRASPDLFSRREGLESALERSGLAFAGANDYLDGKPTPQGVDDGILFASELADGDFMRTDLVTLSACQTGLGDVAGGDGVHGLQRALLSAGARTVVCSMWDVPDRPTRELFSRFYAKVLAGTAKNEALQKSIRELAGAYPRHPVAWGGFILLGDTDKLARFSVRQLRIATVTMPRDEDDDSRLPPARRAERLITRAEAQAQRGNVDESLATLTEGLRMKGVPPALTAGMLYSRAGINRKAGRLDAALGDYAAIDALPDVPPRRRQSALFDRGTTHLLARRWAEAIEAYTAFLDGRPAPADAAMALVNRAGAYLQSGDRVRGTADLAAIIDGPAMPADQRAKALVIRAEVRQNAGDAEGARSDVDRVVNGVGALPVDLAGAYLLRGLALENEQRREDAYESYRKARRIPNLPPERKELIERLIARLE